MIAAPLKQPIEDLARHAQRSFRDQMIAAPLKRGTTPSELNTPASFRDQMIAAPLKLLRLVPALSQNQLFPRSDDRGPIEARRVLRGEPLGSERFRDQMIAAPLKP